MNITTGSDIAISFISGSTEDGDFYLIPKTEGETPTEIYAKITNGEAVSCDFKWLNSDTYIATLIESTVSGEYYVAFVGRSNNASPKIRYVKALGVVE